MPTTLLRTLKSGVPVALALAGLGYLYATIVGILAGSTAGVEADPDMQVRIPVTMAAWGFGLVAAGELVFGFGRRTVAAAPVVVPAEPGPGGLDPDVERLLNDLLAQADAARATDAAAGSVPPDQVHQEALAEQVAVAADR